MIKCLYVDLITNLLKTSEGVVSFNRHIFHRCVVLSDETPSRAMIVHELDIAVVNRSMMRIVVPNILRTLFHFSSSPPNLWSLKGSPKTRMDSSMTCPSVEVHI